MRIIDAAAVDTALDDRSLVDALREMFRRGCEMPVRHHHTLATAGGPDATLLLMPAWTVGGYLGVKIATVFPGNADRGLPAVMGAYLLASAETGEPVALIDGPMLTLRRTAAASALASGYLSRDTAACLFMVGTGKLAPHLIRAHASTRPIRRVLIWGRNPDKAARLAASLGGDGLEVSATEDLEAAARIADVISCATLSKHPLIRGDWLRPGAHLDLVGGFTPQMREADDTAIRRATVFVDTHGGALAEAGDIVQPIASGVLRQADVAGDLFELSRGERPGRRADDEITLFKSVGTALEDLAAAMLAVERS
jgi:ornithine cyclodeaminase